MGVLGFLGSPGSPRLGWSGTLDRSGLRPLLLLTWAETHRPVGISPAEHEPKMKFSESLGMLATPYLRKEWFMTLRAHSMARERRVCLTFVAT